MTTNHPSVCALNLYPCQNHGEYDMQSIWGRAKETLMTRIELENRVWLLANHEEKNELLNLGLTSKARYVKRVLELGKVYAHV